ncbi:MAG TPA: hypothetical protein VJ249_06240 [Candidatus Bathyarchaeia archaeon]|nr:hypothetical protein [Candidatus Bathyarchaeia archaeon]
MEPFIPKLQAALRKYYWDRFPNQENPSSIRKTRPIQDVSDYILRAWNAKLDRKTECALAGSKLLDSVLENTGRRFASNVEEANDLYLAGMDAAGFLWDELDSNKGNQSSYQIKVNEIITALQEESAAGKGN